MDSIAADAADAHLHASVFPLLKRCGAMGGAVTIMKTTGRAPFTLTRTFGYADPDDGVPVDASGTWFDCGACAQLVAVLTVLSLLERYNIPVTMDVNKVLPPGVRVETTTLAVKLEHLLTFTSGIVRSTSAQPSASDPAHSPSHDQHQQASHKPQDCSTLVKLLRSVRLSCRIAPGVVYRPSHIDILLLAAVAEHLAGGAPYAQLAMQCVLEPLGITLGHGHTVRSFSPAGDSASAFGEEVDSDTLRLAGDAGSCQLTPLSGLILTPQGAAKLLAAIVPGPASAGGGDTPSAAASQQPYQGVISPAMLQQVLTVHLTDSQRELPVGYLLSCPHLGHVSCCFCILHPPAEQFSDDGTSVEGLQRPGGAGGGDSRAGALHGSGCQAVFAVVPTCGFGICVLCNTAEAQPGNGFARQVVSSFLQRFRPLQQQGALVRPWLLNMPPVRNDPIIHFLCFPPVGCHASVFERWGSGLPDYVRVRAVQLPGRGMRSDEPSLLRIPRIATAVADAAAALTPADTPLVLFGHGFGALCAFETARRLEGLHGRRPLLLLVSGCASPNLWPSNQQPHRRYSPWSVAPDTARHLGLPPGFSAPFAAATQRPSARGGGNRSSGEGDSDGNDDDGDGDEDGSEAGGREVVPALPLAHELSDDKLLAFLAACPRTPKALRRNDPVVLINRLDELRADLEAEEMYVYCPPAVRATGAAEQLLAMMRQRSETEALLTACQLSCPLVVLRGEADATLSPEASEDARSPSPAPPPARAAGHQHRPVGSGAQVAAAAAAATAAAAAAAAVTSQQTDALPPLLQGWAQVTSGALQSLVLPGDHLYWEEESGDTARIALLNRIAQMLARRMTVHTSWLSQKQGGPVRTAGQQGGRPPTGAMGNSRR